MSPLVKALRALRLMMVCLAATFCVPSFSQEQLEKKEEFPRETGEGKSYLVPALEIPAFIILLNGFDRLAFPDAEEGGVKVYSTNLSTFWEQLEKGAWVVDKDSFAINQFGHPYQGSMYHGFARSAGLNYWESLCYANAGSFLWEMAGETTPPSVNDQVASGIGGSFIGEALFRMANLALERGEGKPGFWREMCAALASPPLGFNRYAFKSRFRTVFPSNAPAVFWNLRAGASFNTQFENLADGDSLDGAEATAGFAMTYGIPGKRGYGYTRPFDYFHFEIACLGNRESFLDDVMIHGLLLGKGFDRGGSFSGIWGLYGGYDYISPNRFRVSSTSLSFGSTFRYGFSRRVSLQGTALCGVGFTAAGDEKGTGERDYRYGLAPQGLLRLRVFFGERAMFDFTGRSFYLTGIGDGEPAAEVKIHRHHMKAGLTFRIKGRHAAGIDYTLSSRDARLPDHEENKQRRGTISVVYTLLGGDN